MISLLSFVGMQVSLNEFACFPELIIVLLETESCLRRLGSDSADAFHGRGVPASAANARDMIAEWGTLTYKP